MLFRLSGDSLLCLQLKTEKSVARKAKQYKSVLREGELLAWESGGSAALDTTLHLMAMMSFTEGGNSTVQSTVEVNDR